HLIERCLDKDPGRRPAPRDILAELGGAGLTPGWLPESLIRDISQPGPATPVPSLAVSAPPTFGSPSPSPFAPSPAVSSTSGTPPFSAPMPPAAPSPAAAHTGGIMAAGAPTGAPGDPQTVTNAHLSPSAVPPWPGGASKSFPPAPRPPARRRRLATPGPGARWEGHAGGVPAGVAG